MSLTWILGLIALMLFLCLGTAVMVGVPAFALVYIFNSIRALVRKALASR